MRTFTTPAFTSSRPFAVVKYLDSKEIPTEILATCDCLRCVEEDYDHHRSMGHLGLEIAQLRPVPAKGASGGWKTGSNIVERGCRRAARISQEDAEHYGLTDARD
jgi:hypothetical protein